MFRRTTQDARSNPFTSSLSLASINSTSGSTTNDLPTTSTPTNNNATNLTDEEANHSEKSTFFTKFTKKGKKSKTPKIPVPTRKATPEEIRTFLAALLTAQNSQFADDTTKCDEIVSDWKIGGGVEVRQYGPAMYLEMFGREYGWILYREVRMSIRKESNILLRRPLYTSLIASFLLEVLTVTLLVHLDLDEGVEVVVILASVAAFLTLFVSLIILCAGNSPAKIIERDLRNCSKAMAGAKA
ncbi:hypothetical protein Q7P36_008393 [Cladosporium allicinum]